MSIKTRKSNGQGHTFKVGNSWKTVITSQGRTVTATAKTQQESKRRAKEKVHQLPAANNGKVLAKRDKFSDSIGIIRDRIVEAVLILLALGRD